MRLLIVNLILPNRSEYINYKVAGGYLWGKRLNQYLLFCLDGDNCTQIFLESSDSIEIQKQINEIFGG